MFKEINAASLPVIDRKYVNNFLYHAGFIADSAKNMRGTHHKWHHPNGYVVEVPVADAKELHPKLLEYLITGLNQTPYGNIFKQYIRMSPQEKKKFLKSPFPDVSINEAIKTPKMDDNLVPEWQTQNWYKSYKDTLSEQL